MKLNAFIRNIDDNSYVDTSWVYDKRPEEEASFGIKVDASSGVYMRDQNGVPIQAITIVAPTKEDVALVHEMFWEFTATTEHEYPELEEAKEDYIPMHDFVDYDPNPNAYNNIILANESELKDSIKVGK